MLLQLEQECLDVYRRKVDHASKYKAELHQLLADAEAEAANLVAALGERALNAWVCFLISVTFMLFRKYSSTN